MAMFISPTVASEVVLLCTEMCAVVPHNSPHDKHGSLAS